MAPKKDDKKAAKKPAGSGGGKAKKKVRAARRARRRGSGAWRGAATRDSPRGEGARARQACCSTASPADGRRLLCTRRQAVAAAIGGSLSMAMGDGGIHGGARSTALLAQTEALMVRLAAVAMEA